MSAIHAALRLICQVTLIGAALLVGSVRGEDPAVPFGVRGLQFGPETTLITEPLRADGMPDYVKALNQKMSNGVSREENFWVLMWPAMGNAERSDDLYLEAVEKELGITIHREPNWKDLQVVNGYPWGSGEHDEKLWEQQGKASQNPWQREEFPGLVRWLDANEKFLADVTVATRRPKAYAPMIASQGDGGTMVSILLPHVQATRECARQLSARVMLHLGEGNHEACWEDLLTCYRLAKHVEQGPTLIEQLVAYAIRAIASAPTMHYFSKANLTAQQLDEKWEQLSPLLATRRLDQSVSYCERMMYLDVVIAMRSGRIKSEEILGWLEPNTLAIVDDADEFNPPSFDFRIARQAVMRMILNSGDVNEILRHGNGVYDRMGRALAQPTHLERMKLLGECENELKGNAGLSSTSGLLKEYFFASDKDYKSIPARLLTSLLVPAISAVENASTRSEAYSAILETGYRIRRATITNPKLSLANTDDLIELQAAIAMDPYTGKPLRILSNERGLVIYTLGQNGADDGGLHETNPQTGKYHDDINGVLQLVP